MPCSANPMLRLAMHQPIEAQPTPDFDGDGTVGFSDFLAFAGQFGAQDSDGRYQAKYDLNSDGAIDFDDFLLFVNSYGQSVPPTNGGDSEIVEIPDASLRAVIERRLEKARGAPITRADMATLRGITAQFDSISDLTGLEFATNLTELYLHNNQISDIAALSGLNNLERLRLGDNQISDIAVLSGLNNLTLLDLDGNQISDIAVLSGLTNLTRLYLQSNQISDIAPLFRLTKLEWLDLRYNPLSDRTINTYLLALLIRGVVVYFDTEGSD